MNESFTLIPLFRVYRYIPGVPKILWPFDVNQTLPTVHSQALMKMPNLISSLLGYLLQLLTFGLFVPPIALGLAILTFVKIGTHCFALRRYLLKHPHSRRNRNNDKSENNYFLNETTNIKEEKDDAHLDQTKYISSPTLVGASTTTDSDNACDVETVKISANSNQISDTTKSCTDEEEKMWSIEEQRLMQEDKTGFLELECCIISTNIKKHIFLVMMCASIFDAYICIDVAFERNLVPILWIPILMLILPLVFSGVAHQERVLEDIGLILNQFQLKKVKKTLRLQSRDSVELTKV
jgi:hypothetical protein